MTLDNENLSEDLLELILQFIGNVPDLLSCERSCRSVSTCIRTRDTVWSTCHDGGFAGDARLPSHREKACVAWSLRQVDILNKVLEKRNPRNVFSKAFGDEGWRNLINRIIAQPSFIAGDPWLFQSGSLYLRNDALDSLMHIVEGYFDGEMRRANKRTAETYEVLAENGVNAYPVLSVRHTTDGSPCLHSPLPDLLPASFEPDDVLLHWPNKDVAIRRIARRNGVVKMHNDVYDVTWKDMLLVMSGILRHAVTLYQQDVCPGVENADKVDKKRLLGEGQTIFNTSPFPRTVMQGGRRVLLHTIVSGQIEQAAEWTGVCRKLYGGGWLGSYSIAEIENEVDEAALQYEDSEKIDCMMESSEEDDEEEAERLEGKIMIKRGELSMEEILQDALQAWLPWGGHDEIIQQLDDEEMSDVSTFSEDEDNNQEIHDEDCYDLDGMDDDDEDDNLDSMDDWSYDSEIIVLGRDVNDVRYMHFHT